MNVNHTMQEAAFVRESEDRRFVEACEQAQRIATRTGKQMRVYRAYQQFSVKHADLPWYGQHLTLINP